MGIAGKVIAGVVGVGCVAFTVMLVTSGGRRREELAVKPEDTRAADAAVDAVAGPDAALPPPDPAALAAAEAALGPLPSWTITDAPCPHELPRPPKTLPRQGTMTGIDGENVALPPSPFPIVGADDVPHLMVALAAPVEEPTLVILQSFFREPAMENRRFFKPGRVEGMAFLRLPGPVTIACAGTFVAESSEHLAGHASETAFGDLDNQMALIYDLDVQRRRAAIESLRIATRSP